MKKAKLEIVDGRNLAEAERELLRPGDAIADDEGKVHHLPRFFYAVASWADANEIKLAQHFSLAELMRVDCREADLLLHGFPHYVPCAVTLLAGFLEGMRRAIESPVFVATNGGYRSPTHERNQKKSAHCWGTAADIYRVGDTYLDDEKSITRYGDIAESLGRQVFVRPYCEGDDHLHIDLGFVTVTPRECSEA